MREVSGDHYIQHSTSNFTFSLHLLSGALVRPRLARNITYNSELGGMGGGLRQVSDPIINALTRVNSEPAQRLNSRAKRSRVFGTSRQLQWL